MRLKVSDAVLLLSESVSGVYKSDLKKVMDQNNIGENDLKRLKKYLNEGNFKIRYQGDC